MVLYSHRDGEQKPRPETKKTAPRAQKDEDINMTMTRNITSYTIDHATKAIIFTNKSFLRRANNVGSKEYNEVCGLRHDFPGYQFQKDLRKGIHNNNDGLAYEDMEKHIKDNKTEEEVKKLLEEMKMVRAKHDLDANPYKAVQAWFFEKFPDVKAQKEKEAAAAKAKRAAAKAEKEAK